MPCTPQITFIIPAYNEAKLIGSTLDALGRAAAELGLDARRIVVNDGSTDQTGPIAQAAGAHVVDIHRHQIAAARNAGAKVARSEVLIFVDADTTISTTTIDQAMRALEGGAIGGGAPLCFAESVPLIARLVVWLWNRTSRWMHWAAGSFIFVRREAFEAVGGFDEQYFASEELHLSGALKQRGSFVIVDQPVQTSARKLRLYSIWAHLRMLCRYLLTFGRSARRRENLHLWYDGRRET